MKEKLRMNAYYYGFNETGCIEIDRILSAVASAGKAHHDTMDWNDEDDDFSNKSHVDLIQEAANEAAKLYLLKKLKLFVIENKEIKSPIDEEETQE